MKIENNGDKKNDNNENIKEDKDENKEGNMPEYIYNKSKTRVNQITNAIIFPQFKENIILDYLKRIEQNKEKYIEEE